MTAPGHIETLVGVCRGAVARLRGETAEAPAHARLDRLAAAFGLSSFERDVLLLAVGVEVDETLTPALAELDPAGRGVLSFALPLARHRDAHWSALSPEGPLRRHRLIEMAPGRPVARAEIVVDERILHHLVGLDPLDARLAPHLARVVESGWLPDSLLSAVLDAGRGLAADPPPLVEIDCDDPRDARVAAAAASAAAGQAVWRLHGADIPAAPAERQAFAELWAREALLAARALLIEGEVAPGALDALARGPGTILLHGRAGRAPAHRPRLRLRLPPLPPDEQAQLWRSRLGTGAARLNGELEAVTRHFTLGYSDVAEAAGAAAPALAHRPDRATTALWEAARGVARPRLRDLATEIVPRAGWRDLVVPDRELRALRAICAQVRHRQTVYRDWGFAPDGGRGLGVATLFAGPSGAGKTMAAEVVAAELSLDLFRIDLARVVNKYIGETEKNLAAVFDAAEDGGAILLFDEADALFGKRSEVRDSHDRYANMEISYLLQRMESYSGLAILTTNFRAALDKAFTRRLRFAVEFPFPGYEERLEIRRRAFPPGAALDGVEPERLARLGVAGGSIRNIALNAAFLAAEEGGPIRMRHLAMAAETECVKLEKTITRAETGGWT